MIVTHGNLLALLLNYFDADFGFTQWKELSNPDIFEITFLEKKVSIKRIWRTNE
ncbi:MAG: hypothetical protein ABF649_08825 [Bacillus sp. (in: firmicutes)]